jgi:hypothetical protein
VVIKILHVILLASVKYIITLPYAMVIGLEYKQAIFAVLIGGIGGFLFFYYLSKPVFRAVDKYWPVICKYGPPVIRAKYKVWCERKQVRRKTKVFSRKNRTIAKIKRTYGLWGIVLTTPLFLTIPVGAFLASKYYSRRKYIVGYMILSIIGWAAVLSILVHLFPNIFF